MPDLMNRLAALHDGTPTAVRDEVVAGDLRRGRTALTTRRRRRVAVAGVAAVAAVAAGSISVAAVTGGSAPPVRAAASSPSAPGSEVPGSTMPTTSNPRPAVATVRLVAYQGAQLPGYTVAQVPEGFVLQGISGSVLAVAPAGDTSPLDTFEGKLVVMLDDQAPPVEGSAVSVGGMTGHLTDDDGTLLLRYDDGTHHVTVQAWKTVAITPAALIAFAEGVTVLPSAVEGHG